MSRLLPFPRRPSPQPETDHVFVDNVRFWSMFSLIALSCLGALNLQGGADSTFQQALSAPLRFGAIGFFLISGFLFGERSDAASSAAYFRQRLHRLLLPWISWFLISSTALLLLDPSWARRAFSSKSTLLNLLHGSRTDLIAADFWFIPNLLCALGLLLLLKRHLYRPRLGALLCAINAFYIVNVYTGWIPGSHFGAIFAYTFYLWLGAFAARHQRRLRIVVDLLPTTPMLALAVVSGLMSFGEWQLLSVLHPRHATDTLRASNQLFSLVVVLLFLKLRRPAYPRFIDVRNHTFGLYLSHSLVVLGIRVGLQHLLETRSANPLLRSALGQLTLSIASLALTYTLCLALCAWIARRPSLHWAIGLVRRTPRPFPTPASNVLTWTVPTPRRPPGIAASR